MWQFIGALAFNVAVFRYFDGQCGNYRLLKPPYPPMEGAWKQVISSANYRSQYRILQISRLNPEKISLSCRLLRLWVAEYGKENI